MTDNAIIKEAREKNDLNILLKDYAIDALLKSYAIFSSRKNFNDIFDSKVYFVKPTPKDLKDLKKLVNKDKKIEIDRLISKGRFTVVGNDFLEKCIKDFNALLDSYPFYSLSKNCTNNLMWSHYADSHYGFCIEFKKEFMMPHKIKYQELIPSVYLIDIIKDYFSISDCHKTTTDISNCLETKLNYWSYEEEYRFHAGNNMKDIDSNTGGKIPEGKNFLKYPYENEAVESIIFGCRMDKDIKDFIKINFPYKVKFKHAVINMKKSIIEIRND